MLASTALAVAAAPPGPPALIDRTTALTIGPLSISHYVVEKNFLRFAPAGPDERAHPTAEEKRDWFSLFLSRQVVSAKAFSEGYDRRPEVTRLVEKMTRYMLTQSAGPFYQSLAPPDAPESELRALYTRTGSVPNVIALRLPAALAAGLSGQTWETSTTEDKIERLRTTGKEVPDSVLYDGPLPWPHEPFPELENELAETKTGRWIRLSGNHPDRVTLAYVRNVVSRDLLPFESASSSFAGFVRHVQQDRIVRERRAAILGAAKFTFDHALGGEIARAVATVDAKLVDLPSDSFIRWTDRVLAGYRAEGQKRQITVGEWRQHYNGQFIRQRPTDLTRLEQNVQDIAMEDIDYGEALRRGIDRTPQFAEDQKNFRQYQALDLFEKERLLPQISVSAEEVAADYRAQPSRFATPFRALGVEYRFPSLSEASTVIRQMAAKPGPQPVAAGESCAVSVSQPLPGFETMTGAILHLPDGKPFGPVPGPDKKTWLVFVKQSSVSEIPPLAAVAERIRSELIRARLEARERVLAREWATSFPVQDTIRYEHFGVANVEKPWVGETPAR